MVSNNSCRVRIFGLLCCLILTPAMFKAKWKPSRDKMFASSKVDEFPVTLEGFGYHFNENGQLRSLEGNIPFRFDVKKGNKAYNQAHYEALGKVIDEDIYMRLVHQEDLERVVIPLDAVESEAKSIIFLSKNIKQYEKLLILIHGSGVVRAGQWTRKLIINHSLDSGSQIPYIRKAKEDGYGIVVLNTNQNQDIGTQRGTVRGSETPEDHFLYVWDKVIVPTGINNICIMAHSYGGIVVIDTVRKRLGEFMDRVFAVAMSDSIHGSIHLGHTETNRMLQDWFKKLSKNWVSSREPLNCHVNSPNPIDSNRVSAGTTQHIETSWYAFTSVFKFFEQTFNQRIGEMLRLLGNGSTPSSPSQTMEQADSSGSPNRKPESPRKWADHPVKNDGERRESKDPEETKAEEEPIGAGVPVKRAEDPPERVEHPRRRVEEPEKMFEQHIDEEPMSEDPGNSDPALVLLDTVTAREDPEISVTMAQRQTSDNDPVEHEDTEYIQMDAKKVTKDEL